MTSTSPITSPTREVKKLSESRQRSYALAAAVAGLGVLVLGLLLGNALSDAQLSGLVEAGAATAWGLPISRLCVDVSAVGTIGMLLTAVLLPREAGQLSGTARRCLRSASGMALIWGAAGLAMLLFSWSDVTALSVMSLPVQRIFDGPDASFPDALAYLFCAVLAMVISAVAGTARSSRVAVFLLVVAGYNLLPLTTTGHAQHSSIVAYALTVHVVALTLWIGGLSGLLIHVRTSPELLAVAVPRFSKLALICFVAVGATGLTMAWSLLGSVGELWGSRYGLLVLCKMTALASLGVFGWWHRRRTVRAVATRRSRGAFIRLAAVEVVLMVATIALGVALSRSPTPGTGSGFSHSHAMRAPVSSTPMI